MDKKTWETIAKRIRDVEERTAVLANELLNVRDSGLKKDGNDYKVLMDVIDFVQSAGSRLSAAAIDAEDRASYLR